MKEEDINFSLKDLPCIDFSPMNFGNKNSNFKLENLWQNQEKILLLLSLNYMFYLSSFSMNIWNDIKLLWKGNEKPIWSSSTHACILSGDLKEVYCIKFSGPKFEPKWILKSTKKILIRNYNSNFALIFQNRLIVLKGLENGNEQLIRRFSSEENLIDIDTYNEYIYIICNFN